MIHIVCWFHETWPSFQGARAAHKFLRTRYTVAISYTVGAATGERFILISLFFFCSLFPFFPNFARNLFFSERESLSLFFLPFHSCPFRLKPWFPFAFFVAQEVPLSSSSISSPRCIGDQKVPRNAKQPVTKWRHMVRFWKVSRIDYWLFFFPCL